MIKRNLQKTKKIGKIFSSSFTIYPLAMSIDWLMALFDLPLTHFHFTLSKLCLLFVCVKLHILLIDVSSFRIWSGKIFLFFFFLSLQTNRVYICRLCPRFLYFFFFSFSFFLFFGNPLVSSFHKSIQQEEETNRRNKLL